jgi:hypothetical protein
MCVTSLLGLSLFRFVLLPFLFLLSRERYEQQLTSYFQDKALKLSADSRERLQRGAVLRILDSKHAQDVDLVSSAPSIIDSLTPAASEVSCACAARRPTCAFVSVDA